MSSLKKNDKKEKDRIICYFCKKVILQNNSVLSCKHNLCLHCLCLSLINSEFRLVTPEKITFKCFCEKGTIEYSNEVFINLFETDGLTKKCIKHKTESDDYCKDCKAWVCEECKKSWHKDLPAHRIVNEIPIKRNKCEIHNKSIEYYCKECKKELCILCNKDEEKHKNSHEEIANYSSKLKKDMSERCRLQNTDDFNHIIGDTEKNFRTELLSEYNKKKSKIEKVIKSFQVLLQRMKEQVDKEIKFATEFYKILRFSYTNYFSYFSSDVTPTPILQNILSLKKELQKIEIIPKPSIPLDTIIGLTTKVSEKELVKFNLIFEERSESKEKTVLTFHSGHEEFMSAFYKVNDQLYISGSLDKTIHTFAMDGIKQTLEFKHCQPGYEGSIQCICSFNNGDIALGSYDSKIGIWNTSSFTYKTFLEGHTKCVRSLSFVPCSIKNKYDKLISSSDDCSIRVWNLKTYNCEINLEDKESMGIHNVISILFGNIIIGGNNSGTLSIYQGKNVALVSTIGEQYKDDSKGITELIVFNKDQFISGNKEGIIRLYKSDGSIEEYKKIQAHNNWVTTLLAINEKKIASGGRDQLIKIWNIEDGSNLLTLSGHFNTIVGIYLTNHGFIISGGADGLIKIWKQKVDS